MTKSYRLRLWNFTGSAVQWSFASNVLSAPTVGGQVVRPLDGRTETKPWIVNVIDTNDEVTSAIADDGGRLVVMRRKADVQVSIDGAAYTTMATGRVTGLRITAKSPLVYEFEISDERLLERTTKLWNDSSSTRIYPVGFTGGSYGPFINSDRYFVDSGGNPLGPYFSVLSLVYESGLTQVVLPVDLVLTDLPRVINADVKPGLGTVDVSRISSGSFYNLRANIGGVDYEVVAFTPLLKLQPGSEVDLGPTPVSFENDLRVCLLLDPDSDIEVGDEFYLHFPSGRPPDESAPYHIDSVDPFQLVKDIYDDIGVSYDTDRLGTYNQTTNPAGLIGHPWFPGDMRWRITQGEAVASSWLEDNIFKPLGVLPSTDADGNVVPVPLLMTWTYEVPDPDALFTFDDSNIAATGLPTWEHDIGTLANVIEATYTVETQGVRDLSLSQDSFEGAGLDGIVAEEATHTVKHDTADSSGSRYFGENVHEISLAGLHDTARVRTWIGTTEVVPGFAGWVGGLGPGGLASELFQRFGDGAVLSQLKGLSSTSAVSVGDWVLVDSEVMPSPDTGDRSGERLMQVIGKETAPDGYNFSLLDGGPNMSPLSAPTITIAQHTRAPEWYHILRATVTNVLEDATWIVQVAEYPSQPAASSTEWKTCATGVSTGTSAVHHLNVGGLPSNARFYFRARATQSTRIGSGWSAAETAITVAYGNPTTFAYANVTGGTADLTWSLASDNKNLRPLLESPGHIQPITLPAGTEAYTITGLIKDAEYPLTVRLLDPYYTTDLNGTLAGTTGTDSVTFTTTSTYPTLTAPASIAIDVGADSTISGAP